MARVTEIRKIAFIGDYLPRKCGIATFTSDLCRAVAAQYPSLDCTVGAVNDVAELHRPRDPPCAHRIPEADPFAIGV